MSFSVQRDPLWITASGVYQVEATLVSKNGQFGLPAQIAISPTGGIPYNADWVAAEWDGKVIRGKVGPISLGGLVEMQPGGSYSLWARIQGADETPEIYIGEIRTYGEE